MTRIGLISDTHNFLDDQVFRHFEKCDEIWHAGDFGPAAILDQLKAFKPTRGVYGNIDGPEIRSELPAYLSWEHEGVRVLMTHIGGYPGNYDRRAEDLIVRYKPELFISGHSHILKAMRDEKYSLLHMNPGACGHHGWHKTRTLLRFTIDAGVISGVEAVELGPRGRKP